MSLRKPSQRISRQGFSPIPNDHSFTHMGDATIDIPMSEMQGGQTFANGNNGLLMNNNNNAGREESQMFGGRRIKKNGEATTKEGYYGEADRLNKIGRIYKKITEFSLLTRYLVYITPIALCIAVPIVVGATSAQTAAIGGVRIVWFFTWIEIGECRVDF